MYFSGRIHSIVYEDSVEAFYITRMILDDEAKTPRTARKISVRGHIAGLDVKEGLWFGFEGNWQEHSEFGPQLEITKAPVFKGVWDAETANQLLLLDIGSGPLCAIQSFYKEDFPEILKDTEALKKVPGISDFLAAKITQQWLSKKAQFQTVNFLNELGIPPGKVARILKEYGSEAERVLSMNPYLLIGLEDITFGIADEVALKLGLGADNFNRIKGAVRAAVKDVNESGHIYARLSQIVAGVHNYLPQVTEASIARAIKECNQEKILVLDKTHPEIKAVYDPWFWDLEVQSAELLVGRVISAGFSNPKGIELKTYLSKLSSVGPLTRKAAQKKTRNLRDTAKVAVEEWGSTAHLALSETQKEGIVNALTEPVSVLAGLPGTGKTTSLYAAVRILQDAGIPFLLCAPTGIAAKRLASLTHATAYTIHRAFRAKGKAEDKREFTYEGIVGTEAPVDNKIESKEVGDRDAWGYGPKNPHPAEVVIIDESSMLDQHLLHRLLTCTSARCRMVFVGDAAQLPPVGPGNVLRDLINSKLFPTVSLTEIFRQRDTSDIVFASHAIYRGEVPESQKDFKLVEVANENQAQETIVKLVEKLYDKRFNFQVLSPRHAGTVGVTSLNSRLRELLNPRTPGRKEIKLGINTIREEDRIMVIKNDYDLDIYNGDVGKISRIDTKSKEVEITIFGELPQIVSVPFKRIPELLRLAYACTVHKAQGLEYDCIVMPLMDSFKQQLQRNLLYTAVTRAKHRVFLIGTKSALVSAVQNDREDQRNTLLCFRLQQCIK